MGWGLQAWGGIVFVEIRSVFRFSLFLPFFSSFLSHLFRLRRRFGLTLIQY